MKLEITTLIALERVKDTLYYCFQCNKSSRIKREEGAQQNRLDHLVRKCPSCGYLHEVQNCSVGRMVVIKRKEREIYFLESQMLNVSVYDNGITNNTAALVIKYVDMIIYYNVMIPRISTRKISINFKTGQSYYIGAGDLKGNHYYCPKELINDPDQKKRGINNISYGLIDPYHFSDMRFMPLLKELLNIVEKGIAKYSYVPSRRNAVNIDTEISSINDIILYNRFPFLPMESSKFLVDILKYHNGGIKYKEIDGIKFLKGLKTRDSVQSLVELSTINTFSKKAIIKDPSKYVSYLFAKSIFQDVNTVNKVMSESNANIGYRVRNFLTTNDYEDAQLLSFKDEPVTELIKLYVDILRKEGFSEAAIYSKSGGMKNLLASSYVYDITRMYNELQNYLNQPELIISEEILSYIDKKRYLKGNIEEIHNSLSLIINGLKYANIIISYSDEEKEMNWEKDGMVLRLAKDTAEIRAIGTLLDICVGSKYYTERALNKQIYICTLIKDGKYIACLEIQKHFANSVWSNEWTLGGNAKVNKDSSECSLISRQVKGKHNNYIHIDREMYEFLCEWHNGNKIDYKDCYDMESIKNKVNNVEQSDSHIMRRF